LSGKGDPHTTSLELIDEEMQPANESKEIEQNKEDKRKT
jgi:hypothetical protein